MALWQLTFNIIPSQSLSNLKNVKFDEDNLFDDSILWEGTNYVINSFEGINNIILRTKSWSDSIILWGDIQSNCFEIFTENNKISSVSFRVDFVSEYDFILSQIIEFCIFNGLLITDNELNLLPLNFESIKIFILASPQVKKYNSFLAKDL